MTAVLVTLLAVVAAILAVLVVGALRVRARRAIAGTTRVAGARRPLDVLGSATPQVLVFLTSTCTTCAAFWRALASWGKPSLGDARIVVVTKSEDAERAGRVRELSPPAIRVVMSTEAWLAYGVERAPHFVYVDGPHVLVEGDAPTWDDVVAACDERAAR